VALGSALASLTGAAAERLDPDAVAPSVLSTLVVGALWGHLLRSRETVKLGPFRPLRGWAASLLLAPLNAFLAAGAYLSMHPFSLDFDPPQVERGPPPWDVGRFIAGGFAGATFGGIVWVPALLLTLLVFALPIRRAQKLAERGLAGEEKGERTAGYFCAALGALAVALGCLGGGESKLAISTGILAVLTGGYGALAAGARAKRRKAFLDEVTAGNVPGYRVQLVDAGPVLLRTEKKGSLYRAAEDFEAIYEVDAELEADASMEPIEPAPQYRNVP
jgi:hypothetical protein